MLRKTIDISMVMLLMILMNYRFTANSTHEAIGMLLALAVLVHNCLHHKWYSLLHCSGQTASRLGMTALNILCAATMFVAVLSGLLISRSLVPGIALHGMAGLVLHGIHQSSAYAVFILTAFHLGWHWGAIWQDLQQKSGLTLLSWWGRLAVKACVLAVIAYGAYISCSYHIGDKLLMQHTFMRVTTSAGRMALDYVLLFACYTALAYYAVTLMRRLTRHGQQ